VCDTIVNVSADGVLFAKNSDRDANESQILEWRPAERHDAPQTLRCTWIEIPQVAQTHAVVLSRPWWMWGAEIGANEHGVVIGNEAVFTREAQGEPALLGMDLLRLALERSTTAASAVDVMIQLLERHGQGGPCSHERPGFTYHNSFLVADRKGAIVLETAGQKWATEDVRSGVRAISNGLTIAGFAEKYSKRVRSTIAGCRIRRERTEASASNAHGPAAMMRSLRDHGDRERPRWSLVNGTLHAPCVHAGGLLASSQTTASLVADLREATLLWATGTSAPCTSIFKPVRVNEPVDLGPSPTNRYDPTSLWWHHERLARSMLRDYVGLAAPWRQECDSVEARWIAEPPSSEAAFGVAERMEDDWLDACQPTRDRRPAWVARTWRELDEAAGMPVLH
jgi:dipeptidase